MKKLLPLILILFATPCFGESYLCIGEKHTGFDAENNFKQVNFNSRKWIVKRATTPNETFPNAEYTVNMHGGGGDAFALTLYCDKPEPAVSEFIKKLQDQQPQIYCKGLYSFVMSKKPLRFILTMSAGYVHDSYQEDVSLEIGQCSRI